VVRRCATPLEESACATGWRVTRAASDVAQLRIFACERPLREHQGIRDGVLSVACCQTNHARPRQARMVGSEGLRQTHGCGWRATGVVLCRAEDGSIQ
jgi:hypothetical protein